MKRVVVKKFVVKTFVRCGRSITFGVGKRPPMSQTQPVSSNSPYKLNKHVLMQPLWPRSVSAGDIEPGRNFEFCRWSLNGVHGLEGRSRAETDIRMLITFRLLLSRQS
jgi:hypothetical protein